jgi:hypothetical protein
MCAKPILMSLAAGLLAVAVAGGCATNPSSAITHPDSLAVEKSGAQLWTAAQWEVTVHHMRLRANWTGQEARKITEFLQSAS